MMDKFEDLSRKAINFDLDTNSLKKVFQSNNPFAYLKAYKQINDFLKQNGFVHRQWSGYISQEPLTPIQVTLIVKKLNQKLPYLRQCVRKFDVTNIGEQYDLMYIFKKDTPTLSKKQNIHEQKQSKGVMSVKNVQKVAQALSKSYVPQKHNSKSKNKNNSL